MLAGKNVSMYNDDKNKITYLKQISISNNGEISIAIQPNGGFVLTK